MRPLSSRVRHRLQLGAAIVASVGSVWIVSRVVNRAAHCSSRPAPTVRYVPPPPPPVFVQPKVIQPPAVPHLTAAFYSALEEGDVKAMAAARTDGASLDPALKMAAKTGKLDVVTYVLDQGANVHYGESDDDAPILQADAHPDVVKLLVERGANEADLIAAVHAGAPNAVTRIIAKDKKAVNPTDGPNPLVEAFGRPYSAETRKVIVDKLLAAGADLSDGDALNTAVASLSSDQDKETLAMVRLLLAKGSVVTGDTIGNAIEMDVDHPERTKVIDALLAGKLAPDATVKALTHITAERDGVVFRKLAARGIPWTYHDGENDGVAPLVDAVESGDIDTVKLMLEAGAPADFHFKDGRCALGSAISGDADAGRMVELLVSRGANVNRRLPDGRTPLSAAAESGDVRMVNAILNAGARVNERVLDETALDVAEKNGQIAVARVLDGHGGKRAPARKIDE